MQLCEPSIHMHTVELPCGGKLLQEMSVELQKSGDVGVRMTAAE